MCTYWRRQWHPTPVLLHGKSHGRRSLVGYSPWGCKESDTTERLHFHFSLSCIGEGNGNPLQCSCLENPRDREAWWAAIYGVAQSRTQLKRLSSSSSSMCTYIYVYARVHIPTYIQSVSHCALSFMPYLFLLTINQNTYLACFLHKYLREIFLQYIRKWHHHFLSWAVFPLYMDIFYLLN